MRHDAQRRCALDDRGGIVVGWLTKLALVLGLLGLVAFDGISLGVAKVSAADAAQTAARDASQQVTPGKTYDPTALLQAARSEIDPAVYTLDPSDITVAADGSVSVTVHREATTLLLYRVGPLEHLVHITAQATGRAA